MKNGSLPVILLALLLIAGLAGGAYFLLSADGDEQETRVSEHDDNGSKARDDNHAVNKPVIKDPLDSGKGSAEPITDPKKTTPEPTDPEPAEPDVIKPEPALPEPPQPAQPADAEWVEETFETKIHGIVRYRKDNRPVPGAEVTAEVADTSGGMAWGRSARAVLPESDSGKPKTKVIGTATTDNDGKYELNLTVTTYREKSDSSDKGGVEDLGGGGLTENWGGWGGESFVAVAKSPGFAPAKSSWLSLTKGQDQEVNLSIAIPAMISGRVIDASTGEGLAGASVTLNPIDTDRGWSAELNATTDAEGQFKIDVSAGQFMISVSAEGYADKGGWQSGIGQIDASEGGDVIVDDIAMLKAGSIIGIIVDDEGKPVEGAMVSSESGAGGWAGSSTNTTITDKDGVFKIDSLKPGAFTLKVRAANFAHKAVENLNISSGQTLDLGEIALDRGVSLTGTVSGPDGSPVADAMVLIRKPSESAFNWAGAGTLVANTATDAEGNFEVMGLSEGDLQVSVTVGGFADYEQDIKIQSSGNRVDIKLSKGGTVVGQVKAVGELDPYTSVSLINHESQSYRWYKTQPNMGFFGGKNVDIDENGQFEFQNIKPGTYLIVASDSKDATAKLDNIKVEEGRETDAGTLTFEGPGKARITVLEDGKPLRDVKVSLDLGQWGGMAAHSAVTDGSGVALIEKVPAGTYLISTDLERDTFDTDARARRSITVVSGKTVEFTLELRPQDGVRLFGRVTMNGQNVFNEVILVGQGPLANTVKTFQISDGGMYEFHGLKHGTYQFHAQISDDRPTAFENVTVTKDGDFEFTRDFRGIVISGTVNTPNNTPEERASVTMMIQDKRLLKSSLSTWLRGIISVNNDGKFELANVPEGEYQITAELAGVGSVTQDVTIQGGDVSGLSLSVEANSGSLSVTVKELVGKAISGGNFAMAQLFDSNGDLVTFSEQMSGLFTMVKGAKVKFPMVKPGAYVVKISASGYLITEIAGVNIKLNEETKIEVTMQASSELHLTVTNPEITQAMLDSAVVKVVDDQGAETAPVTNMLEMWGNQAPPAVPTLIVRYLPPTVREIRIKLEGYAEITVQVDASTGNKNGKQETLITE